MDWLSIVTTVLAAVLGGGWFIYYKANKLKALGEASQAQAEGWAAQQKVYENTIDDLKESCEYIRQDRNLLREENRQLREENNVLREKINELEAQIYELQNAVARQGRQIEALNKAQKKDKQG